jgi:seryl-tRNA synthetase
MCSHSGNQAKQNATEQLARKGDLEKEAKRIEELAVEKERKRDQKIKTIGNYVHDSVPINDNEVRQTTLPGSNCGVLIM